MERKRSIRSLFREGDETGSSIESDFDEEEIKKEILEILNGLPVIHKEIMILKILENYTDEEIANELQLKLGTVKSRIHRARNIIKGRIEKEGDADEVE